MEAMVDPVNETIWASQKAISALFNCTKQNVSYHMGKIFASGELDRSTVVKEILITAQSGARGTSDEKVRYYNLDAIISIGYKVNSIRATKFRIWAANVIIISTPLD
ncbi:MAG: virulence RhuM family protein [Bacteroidales bacterium]|nr:virulence RhuM family protein [Bacteroidales bacterium]